MATLASTVKSIDATMEPTPSGARRIITVDGTFNFRDLGGARTSDGTVLATGRLFRSATLDGLSDDGLATIEQLGVRTVVDLRSTSEIEQHGRFPHERLPVRWLHLDSGVGPPSRNDDPLIGRMLSRSDPMSGLFEMMVAEHHQVLAEALELMAEPEALPLVFHCTSGKDRTGLLAALAQLIAGMDLEDVLVDFEYSAEALRRSDQDLRSRYPVMAAMPAEMVDRFSQADRNWITGAFDQVGGLEGLEPWLDSIGVGPSVRTNLRRRLTDD